MILAGFQQLVFSHSLGGTYDQPVRAVIWHTTEGTTVQGAVSVYKRIQAAPHLTVDPETFERFQHVPLASSAYALKNEQGGCQTNTTGVIQIEVVGKAGEAWSWSPQRLEWLGVEVLKPILDAYPTIPHTVYPGGRMNCDEWNGWAGGIARHADVPENDHWDPGDLDLQRILDYATGDDDMTPEQFAAILGPPNFARANPAGYVEICLNDGQWYAYAAVLQYIHGHAKAAELKPGGGGTSGPLTVVLSGTATPV